MSITAGQACVSVIEDLEGEYRLWDERALELDAGTLYLAFRQMRSERDAARKMSAEIMSGFKGYCDAPSGPGMGRP